jgi:hypothetical protein
MLYKVIKWRINGKAIWEIVDLKEEIWRAYWVEYVIPIEEKLEEKVNTINPDFGNVPVKDLTDIENKALTSRRWRRKWSIQQTENHLYPC